jgi:hypothetical protein
VLAQVNPQASLEVFERDCLVYLGTCVAPRGTAKTGRVCFRYSVKGAGLETSGEIQYGELKRIPLADGERALVTVEPERSFDCGAGPGARVEREVRGGTVGIVLDGRGRPLAVPVERATGRPLIERWVAAMEMYPGLAGPGGRG